jgi:quercetin dioxygenase-like cupin family protein
MMKSGSVAAASILACVIAAGLTLHAQTPTAGKADPVKVDPRHYKVEFENDSVRVLRISYGPGEKSAMHSRPKSVAVYLTDGTGRMSTPEGKSQDIPFKAGGAVWADAGTHLPQNAGSKAFQVIVVELKK